MSPVPKSSQLCDYNVYHQSLLGVMKQKPYMSPHVGRIQKRIPELTLIRSVQINIRGPLLAMGTIYESLILAQVERWRCV